MKNMTSDQWAARYDRAQEYANYTAAQVLDEELWAMRLGFRTAQDYHLATDEAFAESVREDSDWEAW